MQYSMVEKILISTVNHILLAFMLWVWELRRPNPPPRRLALADVPTLALGLAIFSFIIRAIISWFDVGDTLHQVLFPPAGSGRLPLAAMVEAVFAVGDILPVLVGDENIFQ